MNRVDTTKLIIWINQFDPFVQANDASADIWLHSMSPLHYNEAEEAVVQHYRQNPGVKAEPGAILRRALQIRASREAGESAAAIEAPKNPGQQNQADGQLFVSWRDRNRPEWDRLMAEGSAARKRDLESRGLPSHFPGRPSPTPDSQRHKAA